MKAAWRIYLEEESSLLANNVNALWICLKILDTACEQFIIR